MYQLHCIAVSIYLYNKPQASERASSPRVFRASNYPQVIILYPLRKALQSTRPEHQLAIHKLCLPFLYDFVRKKGEAKSTKTAPSSREEGRREREREHVRKRTSSLLPNCEFSLYPSKLGYRHFRGGKVWMGGWGKWEVCNRSKMSGPERDREHSTQERGIRDARPKPGAKAVCKIRPPRKRDGILFSSEPATKGAACPSMSKRRQIVRVSSCVKGVATF